MRATLRRSLVRLGEADIQFMTQVYFAAARSHAQGSLGAYMSPARKAATNN